MLRERNSLQDPDPEKIISDPDPASMTKMTSAEFPQVANFTVFFQGLNISQVGMLTKVKCLL